MKRFNLYNTEDLSQHIRAIYMGIKEAALNDGTYRELSIRFKHADIGYPDGDYCFADKEGYHYRSLERGQVIENKSTKDLFEITYWVIDSQLFWMAVDYEGKNRQENQDIRRILFAKILQYHDILGSSFSQRAQKEINELLKEHPFNDEQHQ